MLVHILNQLMVLLLLEFIKFPFAIVPVHSSELLEVVFDLTVDPIQIELDELMLHLPLVDAVLAVFVQDIEGFLANGHLKIVPVVISHEVFQSLLGKDLSQFVEQPL